MNLKIYCLTVPLFEERYAIATTFSTLNWLVLKFNLFRYSRATTGLPLRWSEWLHTIIYRSRKYASCKHPKYNNILSFKVFRKLKMIGCCSFYSQIIIIKSAGLPKFSTLNFQFSIMLISIFPIPLFSHKNDLLR